MALALISAPGMLSPAGVDWMSWMLSALAPTTTTLSRKLPRPASASEKEVVGIVPAGPA